jgi:hypothetical protein|tara:strand:+ start:722 stop:1321 length:600 start_codon:yes stop_codon:yes gene_type:complete
VIKGDSSEYHLITKHIGKLNIDRATLTCEIGLREGLGSKIIMDAVREHKPNLYKHVAIDPYNNLSYEHYDNEGSVVAGYTEEMKQKTVSYLYENYPEFDFYHMTDDYYFRTMGDGHQLGLFNNMMLFGLYKVVHFDGPHTTEAVIQELNFFIPRSETKALFIIDDYKDLRMGIVDMLLLTYNFKVVEEGENKIIYQKEI